MAHSGLKKTTSARKKSREGGALTAEARCDENKPLEPYEIIRWYQQYLSAVTNSLIEQVVHLHTVPGFPARAAAGPHTNLPEADTAERNATSTRSRSRRAL